MTTSTLNPTQTKVVGGTFEAVAESFLGTPPSYEAREPIVQKAFSGEFTDFQTPKFNTEIHRKTLEAQLAKAHQEVLTAVPITAKRIDVNTKFLGETGNVLYEDTVLDDGTLRRDVDAYLSRKNSELKAEQVKARRENILIQATKKSAPKAAVGPTVNLNTAFEDQNLNRPG